MNRIDMYTTHFISEQSPKWEMVLVSFEFVTIPGFI